MKRIICIITMTVSFALMLAVVTSAAYENGLPKSDETEILRGTPIIDGNVDDIYLNSYCIYLAPGTEGYPDNPTEMEATKDTEGSAFFIYDDNYLYVCVIVRDKTLMSMGKEWCDAQRWPWNNDGAEVFVCLGDGISRSVHVDAYGISGKEHYKRGARDYYKDKDSSEWAAKIIGDDLYVVEIAFPFTKGETSGTLVGVELEIDDRFSMDSEGANARGIFLSHEPEKNRVRLSAKGMERPTHSPTASPTELPSATSTDTPTYEPTQDPSAHIMPKANTVNLPVVFAGGVVMLAVIAASLFIVSNAEK